jgi:hypothetical protein
MRIEAVEGELLLPEIELFARSLHDEAARERYRELAKAVQDGEVPEERLPQLATLLQVSLESGRVRHFYGADGEQALIKLFRRTPAGRALSESTRAVTEGLAGLQGQAIESISLSTVGPGAYSLTIDTDRCELRLRVDRSGARIENVAIGI